jgi:hypothetical protein
MLAGRPQGKRPLERVRHTWQDDIKVDLETRMSSTGFI